MLNPSEVSIFQEIKRAKTLLKESRESKQKESIV